MPQTYPTALRSENQTLKTKINKNLQKICHPDGRDEQTGLADQTG
jgi:hypothetical protein